MCCHVKGGMLGHACASAQMPVEGVYWWQLAGVSLCHPPQALCCFSGRGLWFVESIVSGACRPGFDTWFNGF